MEQSIVKPISRLWAIQLSNSEFRQWRDSDNFKVLSYNWEAIKVPGNSTLRNIKSKVSYQYPNEKVSKVNSISRGIYYYSRLREGDGILGITGTRNVEKIGYVVSNVWDDFDKHSVQIKFEWVKGFQIKVAKRNIFDEDLEIEKVRLEMIESFELPDEFQEFDSEKLANQKSPTKVTRSQIDFTNALDVFYHSKEVASLEKVEHIFPKEDKGGKITLFFGTNRNKTASTNLNSMFGDKLDLLKFGFCDVSIPRGHIQGELERPFKFLFIKFSEKPGEHVYWNLLMS